MKRREVIVGGGGTGGHLYPALAVGRKLQEKDSSLHLTYVGGSRAIEKKIMEEYGAHFIPMKIEGLKGRGWKAAKSILLLPASFFKSFAILLRMKPDLVIGVGGYSSGPIVLLSSWMKIPTLIMEQNLYPGFTNRMLLPWVEKAVVSFRHSLPFFRQKGIFLGNPVREEFYAIRPKERNDKLSLLIFGGSQGSRFLNLGITATLWNLRKERGRLKIFHQTGKSDFVWVKNAYEQNSFEGSEISPYFNDMAAYFEKSDLIISRAGATTIAELIASQRASILIPFSHATDDHQTHNAKEMEEIRGAEVILERDFSPALIAERILYYLENKEEISRMERNLAMLRTENPAGNIADLCYKRMEEKSRGGTMW